MRIGFLSLLVVGLASIAGAAADPAKPGKLHVGVVTVEVVDALRERTIPTEIWYPAETDGRDATPTDRGYPLLMIAHGLCGSRTNYEYLAVHLVSQGFLVAAPDMLGYTNAACEAGQVTGQIPESAADLSYVCRELHDSGGPLAVYAQRVFGVPTGLIGHSLGGRIVTEAVAGDTSFTASVGLAPAARAQEAEPLVDLAPKRAWLVLGGTADLLVDFDTWTAPFFAALPAPAYLVRITDGTHSGFTDVDSGLTPEALAAQQTFVKRYTTAFFVKYLGKKGKFAKRLRTRDDGTVAVTARKK